MDKTALVRWLRDKASEWDAFLDSLNPALMEEPGVVAHWSMKDLVAHLTGWNRHLVARLQAAQQNAPEPSPPWPADLTTDDDVNAWLYATQHGLTLQDVRAQCRQVFEQLFALVDALPEDVRVETVQPTPERAYYRVWLGEQTFLPGEFFDHYQDDHAADVRAWQARVGDA